MYVRHKLHQQSLPDEYLSYNLRAGGNVNINERARWYGMQLTIGANAVSYTHLDVYKRQ